MVKDKSSGLDGFSMLLYQECWDIVKEDLMRFLRKSLREASSIWELMLHSCTHFQEGRALSLSDFWPISLVSSLYKIITKVLSLKLRTVMDKVTSNS